MTCLRTHSKSEALTAEIKSESERPRYGLPVNLSLHPLGVDGNPPLGRKFRIQPYSSVDAVHHAPGDFPVPKTTNYEPESLTSLWIRIVSLPGTSLRTLAELRQAITGEHVRQPIQIEYLPV
jgi:hypothetical protein